MAKILVKVPVDPDWKAGDLLKLLVGSEGAANLAASTPAGGTVVDTQPALVDNAVLGGYGLAPYGEGDYGFDILAPGYGQGEYGYGSYGIHDLPRVELSANYAATDKCATLPVGVKVVDSIGNESSVQEKVEQLADRPRGVTNVAAAATENPNEATISWTASDDA